MISVRVRLCYCNWCCLFVIVFDIMTRVSRNIATRNRSGTRSFIVPAENKKTHFQECNLLLVSHRKTYSEIRETRFSMGYIEYRNCCQHRIFKGKSLGRRGLVEFIKT